MLENKTREEVFSGEKQEVIHPIIFGCLVYIHIPKEKEKKLDPLGKKGIFVGYSDTSKAFKVYIPGFKKIETSRDVTFNEDAAFNRTRKIHFDEAHEELELLT